MNKQQIGIGLVIGLSILVFSMAIYFIIKKQNEKYCMCSNADGQAGRLRVCHKGSLEANYNGGLNEFGDFGSGPGWKRPQIGDYDWPQRCSATD